MEYVDVDEFIGVKGYKAKGKRVSPYTIDQMEFVEPLEKEPPVEETETQQEPDEPHSSFSDDDDTPSDNPLSGSQMSLF